MVDMAHFAGLVAGKVFTGDYDPVAHADVVTTTTHKTLRGPRGGMVLCKDEYAEHVDRGCPMVLGGPLPHAIAAKAVAFQEAGADAFRNYAHRIVENAAKPGQSLRRRRARRTHRRHGQPHGARRRNATRPDRKTGGSRPSCRPYHPQPQCPALRYERRLVYERPSARHTRPYDAGHGSGRYGEDRRDIAPCAFQHAASPHQERHTSRKAEQGAFQDPARRRSRKPARRWRTCSNATLRTPNWTWITSVRWCNSVPFRDLRTIFRQSIPTRAPAFTT